MSKDFIYSVFIGRMQPPHKGHIAAIKHALAIADEAIIVLGSCFAPRTVKNPWTYQERSGMIWDCLTEEERGRVHFVSQRDYPYNDNLWMSDVQRKVGDLLERPGKVALVGRLKDSSSYYLNQFPQWMLIQPPSIHMNATDIRESLFNDETDDWEKLVETPVAGFLNDWILSPVGESLTSEYDFLIDYKARWSHSPYPPTFVTADAVVIKSGHVLMIQRKINPGKGLFALPGGFVGQDELVDAAAIRELKEETGMAIHVPPVDSGVFDDPGRSLRGRTITHAFCFDLGAGDLPKVKGGDDAGKAFWMPISEIVLNSEQIFEDHAAIITHFVNKF
jgi:bifunctional NMN adenylyltransferase/nudix hydrolase